MEAPQAPHVLILDAVVAALTSKFRWPLLVQEGKPRTQPVRHTEPEWFVEARVAYTVFGFTIFTRRVKLFAIYPATSADLGCVDCYLHDVSLAKIVETTLSDQAQKRSITIFLTDIVRGAPDRFQHFHPR